MVVGNAPEAADLVIIGAGPGGYTAALHAASRGRQVLLIDKHGADAIGGVCLHSGCIPSKTLLEAAELYHRAQHSSNMGISVTAAQFNMANFQRFKQSVIGGLANGVKQQLRAAKVQIVTGNATFTEANTLVVATASGQARFIQFRDCIIATGSRPATIPGFEFNDSVLDAAATLQLTEIPKTLAIIGAGYIGLELGCAMAKLGSRVTVIETQARPLPGMPAGVAAPITKAMTALGVEFKLEHRAVNYADGLLTVANDSTGEHKVTAEKILVAIGRVPNTDQLGLETLGISAAANGLLNVAADRKLSAHIAAIGDVTNGPALAHKASSEAIVAVDALCNDNAAFEPQVIPLVVFTDPEIAIAGPDAGTLQRQGIKTRVTRMPLKASGRAATMDRSDGYIELTAESHSNALLAATIVGPHASELIAEICLAIEMGANIEDLALTIHPHPTLSELVMDTAQRQGAST